MKPLLVTIFALAVAGILWGWQPWSSNPAPTASYSTIGDPEAESSYTDVRYWMRDAQGQLLYRVIATHLDQYSEDSHILLEEPYIQWQEPAFADSWAASLRGEIRDLEIILHDAVEVLLQSDHHAPVLMRGRALTLDTERQRIRTDAPVQLSQPEAVMQGIGLDYRLHEEAGTLIHDVRARQFPDRAHPPTYETLARLVEQVFDAAHAEEASTHTLDLSADRMEWDTRRKIYVYHGNVRATLGDMVLQADKLTAHSDDERIQTLHAVGHAVWNQTLESGQRLQARAGDILYQLTQNRAILKEDVHMRVGDHEFTGEHLTYLIDEERLETAADGESQDRIKLQLQVDTP